MSRNQGTPNWLTEEDIAASVREARQSDVPKSSIIGGLDDEVFREMPKERIKAIVDAIPDEDSETGDTSLPLSQDPSTDADPRKGAIRLASSADISYLSPQEAARVVGLALEQFTGNTVRPPANESTECNLYWNQQHRTIGLRIVPAVGEKIGEQHVVALSQGETTVDNIRSPSEVALVTNGWFLKGEKRLAEDEEIRCFDCGHLEAWFSRAKITPDALGTVLEDGEDHDGPLSELVDIPEIPAPVSVDPFEMDRAFDEPRTTDSPDHANKPDREREVESQTDKPPTDETVSTTPTKRVTSSGETGALYADPDQDGDYEAFDRFVDDIEPGMTATPNMEQEETTTVDTEQEGTAAEETDEENSSLTLTEASSAEETHRTMLVLEEIARVWGELGEEPTESQINEQTKLNQGLQPTEFNSWSDAIERCRVEHDVPDQPDEPESSGVSETVAESTTGESSSESPSRTDLLDELERLQAELERPVARQDLKESTYNIFQYNSQFGGWTDALEEAGMIEDAMLSDLERVWDIVGRPPKQSDVLEYGKFEPTTYARQFIQSWEDLLDLTRERKE